MDKHVKESVFDKQKQLSLDGVDLSRKGNVDEPIVGLLQLINQSCNFFSTSSCSGRVVVLEEESLQEVKKKGCHWLFTSHGHCDPSDIADAASQSTGSCCLKYEPFVLHIQCRSEQHARQLLAVAVSSGARNSGISIGNKEKYIVAVRNTASLQVPLTHKGELLVSSAYIEHVTMVANEKLKLNFQRIKRFEETVVKLLQREASQSNTEGNLYVCDQNVGQADMQPREKETTSSVNAEIDADSTLEGNAAWMFTDTCPTLRDETAHTDDR